MAGGPGSGRQKEKPLDEKAFQATVEGLDMTSADGLKEHLRRLDALNLQGKIPAHRFKLAIQSAAAQRALIVEAEVARRVAKVLKARDDIEAARMGGRRLRDVGPPPDDRQKRGSDAGGEGHVDACLASAEHKI